MSRLIAIIILTLLCGMDYSFAALPGTVWRSQLAVPSSKPENVKSNILSPDESKIYVLTEHELYVYNTENGDLLHMYTDELDYAAESSEANFIAAALSADGEKLYIVGTASITDGEVATAYPRFFVFDLSKVAIVYDELFNIYQHKFQDIVYSPTQERVFIASYNTIIRINTNDYTDRNSASRDLIEKLYLSPDENYIVTTGLIPSPSPERYNAVNFFNSVTLERLHRSTEIRCPPLPHYKRGSFTQDSKYFSSPSLNAMYLFDMSSFKLIAYYTKHYLLASRNIQKIDFSKKHYNKGIAHLTGYVIRTAIISFSETYEINGALIRYTGSDFVQMTEAEDFYYEISQDTLSKHILDWGYTMNVSLPEEIRASEVYPNPVDDLLIVDFELSRANATVVELVNSTGISVRRIDAGLLSEGEHHIGVNVADLPAGVYFTRVRSGRSLITNKFMKAE